MSSAFMKIYMSSKLLIDNIQKHLDSKKMTWKALSQTSDIELFRVYRIKQGKTQNPKLSTLQRLARALDTSVCELIKDVKEVA